MHAVIKTAVVVAVCALAVGGCNKDAAPEAPKSMEEAARQSAGLPRPEPGLYRSEVELVSMSAPGMPPQMAEQMKKAMAERSAPNEFCLTAAEAEKGYEESVKKLAGRPECTFDRYSADDGKLDAELTCNAPGGMKSVLTMQGTMTPSASNMTLSMDQSGAQLPGGGMKMTMRIKTQRAGACKG